MKVIKLMPKVVNNNVMNEKGLVPKSSNDYDPWILTKTPWILTKTTSEAVSWHLFPHNNQSLIIPVPKIP